MVNEIRVIQVGNGEVGRNWLNVVKNYRNTEVVAVVDVINKNLSIAQEITGLSDNRMFNDLEEAFHKVEADLVLIVTPPTTHKDIAIKALQSGFHVMMEKPLAHKYEEALQLLDMSQKYDKKIMVTQQYRWRPPIQTVKNILNDGVIGNVGYIEYIFRKCRQFGGWRDEYKEILLEDMAVHHFDILRFWLEQEAVEIYAQSFRPKWSWFKGNPTAGILIRFNNDIHVNYFGSWVSRGKETTWNGDVRIFGDGGVIELVDDRVYISLGESEEAEYKEINHLKPSYDDRTLSLIDMVQAINEDTIPTTNIGDNIYSFELTCAAIKSAESGQKVVLKDFSKINRINPIV